jgi:aspartate racemase
MTTIQSEKSLGVIGGMGPEATVDFMQKLVEATPAEVDQDHIETIVYNDPKIPDRNRAILEGTESPLPRLKENLKELEQVGAQVIAMPCNTAHYYFDDLEQEATTQFINMVRRTRGRLEESNISSTGLLATKTVIEADVYSKEFADSNVELVEPVDKNALMDCIYDIKRQNYQSAQNSLDKVVTEFRDEGIDSLVIACTDLGILDFKSDLKTFDSTSILAESCVQEVRA